MTTIHFYAKLNCASNLRQQQTLRAAGHEVIVHDLLAEPWADDPARLRAFFGDLPVVEWFNGNAPAVKYGEIEPAELNGQQALALLVEQPLLIRRPLLAANGHYWVGFDSEQLAGKLGLSVMGDQERCSHAKPPG